MTIPAVVTRTTAGHAGHVHGLTVGAGPQLDAALVDLGREARRQVEEIALAVQDSADDTLDDAEWRFEVIDVKLIPGCRGDPREAWVAIGTLTSYGRAPLGRELLG